MDISKMYFDWMTSLAIPNTEKRHSYYQLLNTLMDITFYFTIPLDENRYVDGIQLRERFAFEHNIPIETVCDILNNRECSMLEMMVALALRCEEHIMQNPEFGNRLSNWFNVMIESLQLTNMYNDKFNYDWVKSRIDDLLERRYEPNGIGGLFVIDNPRQDLRTVQIWYQMCWYVDTILKDE